MPAGTPLETDRRRAARAGRAPRHAARGDATTRPMPARPRRSTSTGWCASTTCAAAARSATSRSTWSTSTTASEQSHAIATRVRPALQAIGQRHGANVKVVEVPPGPPVLSPIVAEIYGPEAEGRRQVAKAVRGVFAKTEGVVDVDDSSIADAPRTLLVVDRRKAAMLGRVAAGDRRARCAPAWPARPRPTCTTRASIRRPRRSSCRPKRMATWTRCCS